MAAWDCLAPSGILVALVSPGWERPANEAELVLFRRWFCDSSGAAEERSEDTFIESTPAMQSSVIWVVNEPLTRVFSSRMLRRL